MVLTPKFSPLLGLGCGLGSTSWLSGPWNLDQLYLSFSGATPHYFMPHAHVSLSPLEANFSLTCHPGTAYGVSQELGQYICK